MHHISSTLKTLRYKKLLKALTNFLIFSKSHLGGFGSMVVSGQTIVDSSNPTHCILRHYAGLLNLRLFALRPQHCGVLDSTRVGLSKICEI